MVWASAEVLAASLLVVVEARAALAAAQRGARLTAAQHKEAKRELATLLDQLTIVEVTEDLIAAAAELAETETPRGYDAVHLAAALTIEANVVTSADWALCEAAQRRGLHVANPLDR